MMQHSWFFERTCQMVRRLFILLNVMVWEFEITTMVKKDEGEMFQMGNSIPISGKGQN